MGKTKIEGAFKIDEEFSTMLKFTIGILVAVLLAACESGSQGDGISADGYGAGAKLLNVGLCEKVSGGNRLDRMDLVTRDQAGVVTVVASGSIDKGGTYTGRLPDDLAPGWYVLRINDLTNTDDETASNYMPVFVDIADFTILYVLVKGNVKKAVESIDQPAVCNIHNTNINDWFIESNAGRKNIRKFSDGTDAKPVSYAFFAFRQSDATLFVGRMLDVEIIQTLPRPPEHRTVANHNGISRTEWIMKNVTNGGHQVLDSDDTEACFECHEDGGMKPDSFPVAGLSNICHRCHAGATGYTNGLYDPDQ